MAIVYSYQAGLLKSQTDAMGNTTSYAHNTIGQIISRTDADNHVTEYVYDASGNLLRTIDANDKTIVTTYDTTIRRPPLLTQMAIKPSIPTTVI